MPHLTPRRLQRKLVLAFCLILLLPVTAIAAYTFLRLREVLIDRAGAEQLSLAEARAATAESRLSDPITDLLLFTQTEQVHHLDLDLAGLNREQLEQAFVKLFQHSPGHYRSLCLLDDGAMERACVDTRSGRPSPRPGAELRERIDDPAYLEALRLISIPGSHPIAIAEAARAGSMAESPALTYSTAIYNERGRVSGVLVLETSLDPIFDLLTDRSAETRTAIVDSSGRYLLRPELGSRPTLPPDTQAGLADERPVDAAAILRHPSGTLTDTAERPGIFTTFARLRPRGQSNLQWVVIYERPLHTVTGEVTRAQTALLLIALAALAGAVAVAHVVTRSIARPLTALAAAAERVGTGELDTPIPGGGADEIGALAATLERTVARLRHTIAAESAAAAENARLYEAARLELAERQRAEAAHARLATIVDATPDAVGMADLKGHLLYLNPAGRRLFGLGPDADLGAYHVRDFVPEGSRGQMFEQSLPAAIADGAWVGESELRTIDGERLVVSQVMIAHYDRQGKPEYFSTILRDIGERLRVEAELRQSQKMEALGRLAGGVAHDFNNILTVIVGEAELIAGDLPADSPLRSGMEQIHSAASRAAALTSQLLAFSRRQVLNPAVLNLNSAVERVSRMLQRLIGEDITLVLDLAPDLAHVRADISQIDMALMNLCINGRDAMPEGGLLRISTANLPPEAGPAGTGHAGGWVCLSVVDSGAGIDSETQARIFEPFFTTKPCGKGTGLGLATVLGVVQQSGGDIRVISAPGEGTTFQILLPAVTLEPAPDWQLKPQPAQLGGELVLLVEDDAAVRHYARAILERQGCEVLEAADGPAALAVADASPRPIQLLLTDIVMPGGLNGVQLARVLRHRRPELRVLYMSGYSDSAQVQQSLLADEARYLQKPFSSAELARALREALELAGKAGA